MKKVSFLIFFLIACGGKLKDNQRRQFKEGMEATKIRQISEGEILDVAFSYGKEVAKAVERTDRYLLQKSKIDSLDSNYKVKIYSLNTSNNSMSEIEKQILDAYKHGNNKGSDNIQKLDSDSLLFTRPVFRSHPDGSEEFLNAIAIKIPQKVIVLSINK